MMHKVLILEDEDSIRSFISLNLKKNNFQVVEATTGEEALLKAKNEKNIKIALLDVMLPGIDGFEVCKILRDKYPEIGIIMLTAKGQEEDKVAGLVLGADDYIVKPFSPKELIARIYALQRRIGRTYKEERKKSLIISKPFKINLQERKLYKNDTEIELTPKEYAIIKLFLENPHKAISRDEILDKIWGKNYIGDLKIVDVNIRRIRRKIEEDSAQPIFLETVWGYGYRWQGGR